MVGCCWLEYRATAFVGFLWVVDVADLAEAVWGWVLAAGLVGAFAELDVCVLCLRFECDVFFVAVDALVCVAAGTAAVPAKRHTISSAWKSNFNSVTKRESRGTCCP